MHKKIAALALMAFAPFGVAVAASDAPNNTGCGLGSMLFDGQSGLAQEVLAVTTNGSFGNQTFGISSGTLGCAQDGVVQTPVKVSMFLDNNLDKVAHDMASGQGESLAALANLIGIDAAQHAGFFALTKANFATIVPSVSASSNDVLGGLNRVMSADARFAKYAHLI